MKPTASLKLRTFLIGVASLLITIPSIYPAEAATLFTSDLSTCSGYGHGNLRVEDQPLTIPSASSISNFILRVSASSGEASARIRIYDDNADNPGNLLGTFTYTSSNGNLVTYSGSAILPSAGKYWLRFSTTASFTPCYNFNTVFTGSLSGWSVGRVRESVDSGATFTTRSDNMTFLFTINGSGGGSGLIETTLSLSGSSSVSFRQPITTTATLGISGSDGRITFYANSKRIPGCTNKVTSALTVSCTWSPSQRGAVIVTASLTPTNSGFANASASAKTVLVGKRTNTR
jgi:hypothetical protein